MEAITTIFTSTILAINSQNRNSCSLFLEYTEYRDNRSSVMDESINLMLNYGIPLMVTTNVVEDERFAMRKSRAGGLYYTIM